MRDLLLFCFRTFLWPAEGKKNRGDVAAEEGNPRKERDQRRKDDAKEKKKKTKKTNEFRDTTHTCHKKKRAAQRDTKEKHRQQRWGLLPRARTCHR